LTKVQFFGPVQQGLRQTLKPFDVSVRLGELQLKPSAILAETHRNAQNRQFFREIGVEPIYRYAITSNGIFRTCERFEDFLACHRS
jgi:hypothetical protein